MLLIVPYIILLAHPTPPPPRPLSPNIHTIGLGKTLQTISLLAHIKEHEKVTGPSLVICPLSVLYSWCSELDKWAPDLKYLRLHSSCLDEREKQKKAFTEKATSYDVVVTTYDMAKVPSLASLWSRMHFNYLVLDEGHKIKNGMCTVLDRSIFRPVSYDLDLHVGAHALRISKSTITLVPIARLTLTISGLLLLRLILPIRSTSRVPHQPGCSPHSLREQAHTDRNASSE